MRDLPAPGSMAAHDALTLAVIMLRAHAVNCGMSPAEPDPAAWAHRRADRWLGLIAPDGTAPQAWPFDQDTSPPGGTPMITPEPATFAGEIPAEPEVPHDLILSSRVTGTPVHNRANEHIGHVADLSIDKVSGRTLYALIAFGGFLGLGERLHPIPWGALTYDASHGGYVVALTRDELKAAPSLTAAELEDLGAGDGWRHRLDDYYGSYGYPMV